MLNLLKYLMKKPKIESNCKNSVKMKHYIAKLLSNE